VDQLLRQQLKTLNPETKSRRLFPERGSPERCILHRGCDSVIHGKWRGEEEKSTQAFAHLLES